MKKIKDKWNKTNMGNKVALLTTLFLLIDQISKILLDKFLVLGKTHIICDKFIYITKAYNTGVAWSMMAGRPVIIIVVAIVIFIFLLYYMRRFKENRRNILAFSMIFGGLLGNLIDRILYGHVIDFIDIMIFNYDYPIFNIADSLVFIGVILLIWSIYLGEDNESRSKRK